MKTCLGRWLSRWSAHCANVKTWVRTTESMSESLAQWCRPLNSMLGRQRQGLFPSQSTWISSSMFRESLSQNARWGVRKIHQTLTIAFHTITHTCADASAHINDIATELTCQSPSFVTHEKVLIIPLRLLRCDDTCGIWAHAHPILIWMELYSSWINIMLTGERITVKPQPKYKRNSKN